MKNIKKQLAALGIIGLVFLLSCSTNPTNTSKVDEDSSGLGVRAKKAFTNQTLPDPISVKNLFRVPSGKPGIDLTVFVFYAKGGKGGGGGGKPPKDDGGGGESVDPKCIDSNNNTDFLALPFA